ncbi:Transposase, IS4 (plasmid) [Deinococcus gobiensis I-0]|uniref:Transposase, IS4 n=1 Tax=Deinococcus gobiensis (strain DSM 21396 / JCM 16679 / CGMCC 1.7299 / I-0) TaxID=745776 RepID=H8H2P8_DEIGI|nr:Transposase, IS4 [Deinococcus gobiensis I-0]
MDRTTWHYGQTPLNILVLGAILGGAVIPLVWSILPHQGNSCTAARILLVARLLKVLPARRWTVLIADREFVGQEWCSFLRWKRIRQCLRIRENTRVEDELLAAVPLGDVEVVGPVLQGGADALALDHQQEARQGASGRRPLGGGGQQGQQLARLEFQGEARGDGGAEGARRGVEEVQVGVHASPFRPGG